MSLKGLAGLFCKRRWKVDGSICAPICWAVLVENLSEHCRCPFTMSASTPQDQGSQGSLLGAAPLFQDPKYLKKICNLFQINWSFIISSPSGAEFTILALLQSLGHVQHSPNQGLQLILLVTYFGIGYYKSRRGKARQSCIIRGLNSAFWKTLWLLCCTAPRAHKTLRNPV